MIRRRHTIALSLWLIVTASVVVITAPAIGSTWRWQLVDPANGYGSSLRFDGFGRPRVAYWGPGGIWYAESDGETWTVSAPQTPAPLARAFESATFRDAVPAHTEFTRFWFTSLDFDSHGEPRLAYAFENANDAREGCVSFRSRSAAVWINESVESTRSWAPSVSVAPDGAAHVCYWVTGTGELRHAVESTTGWDYDVVDAVGAMPSLTVDAQGRPRVAYWTTNSVIMYAVREGEQWTRIPVATGGTHPSLALDSQGRPRIAFRSSTGNGLFYAERNPGGSWIVTPLGTCYDADAQPALALDAEGQPRIAYVSADGAHLMLASRTATDWTFQPMASVSMSGQFFGDLSIATDRSGHVGITYFGGFNSALEFLTDAPRGIVGVPTSSSAPTRLGLSAWPQPARAGERLGLALTLPEPGSATLTMHDVLGRRVASFDRVIPASGRVTLDWRVPEVSPGVYLLRLSQGGHVALGRVVVVR